MVMIYSLKKERRRKKVSVFDVAKYFLSRVEVDAGSLMTHLKLQKLCYYAQAWHLVFSGQAMFDEHFEAWAHGPVCPDLWKEYKDFSYHPIPAPEDFDVNVFTQSQLETLNEVWDTYGQFDAKYLERLTHSEEPWLRARGSCPPGAACNNIITNESMKEYYSRFIDNGQEN